MKLFSHWDARRETREKLRRQVDEKLEQGSQQKVELEKGDVPALLIAALLNFVLPVMLVLTLICLAAYYLFIR